LVPAMGAGGVGLEDSAARAAALAFRRASSILLICSGVGGATFLPAERVARGGVEGRSDMVEVVW
jgi:hypothetical protein